jgi:hypothetical protein
VKIPSGEISRMGHIGQSYQITQWYPKPAVYDKNGWNPIPYLNQGEFYSEFGSFDVSITLPKNYIVGATGDLQTASEVAFMDQQVALTAQRMEGYIKDQGKDKLKSFPESASEFKTIRYTQSQVHDFAWFADKRYGVLKGEVKLPNSKRAVTSWALFTPQNAVLWKNAIEYINDGTYYYSLWNGDYPYNQVTAVDGTISAGGGMEYPNVTVIGNASSKMELEIVIVHEVGHNWFYGILGSNERVHGWMDEGMNTLNEMRYVQTKYPNNTQFSDMIAGGRFHMNDLDHHDSGDIMYRTLASFGLDQPLETHSDLYSSMNYGAIMYQKTGLVFFYLMDYIGQEKFNQLMSAYFETWKFKHPQPEDMRQVLEKASGKDLSWLFVDLIQTTRTIDYKVKGVQEAQSGTTVNLSIKGQVNGPIGVSLLQNGQVLETKWAEPGQTNLSFLTPLSKIDKVVIDNGNNIPELNRQNNTWAKNQVLHKVEPLRFEWLTGDHEKGKSTLFWTPMIGGNAYDGFMAGVTLHNIGFAPKKFTYLISPMLSTSRLRPAGIAEFSYQILPTKAFELIRLGLSVKSFGQELGSKNCFVAYSPYLMMNLGSRKIRRPLHQEILLQGIYRQDFAFGTPNAEWGGFAQHVLNYRKSAYQLNWTNRFEMYKSSAESISRIWTNLAQTFTYSVGKFDRHIELNMFGGYTLNYNLNGIDPSNRFNWGLNGINGSQDLFLEDYYFGRKATTGLWAQQTMERHGQFHTGNNAGNNLNWLTTATVYAQLPIKPNILGVFADYGFASGAAQSVDMYYNAGVGIRFGKVFGLYLPLVNSSNMGDLYTNYMSHVRFTLRINPVNRLSLHSLLNS